MVTVGAAKPKPASSTAMLLRTPCDITAIAVAPASDPATLGVMATIGGDV